MGEQRASALSRALGWWADGLRQGLPDWLSDLLFGPSSVKVLALSDTRARLVLAGLGREVELFDVPLEMNPATGVPVIRRTRAVRHAMRTSAGEAIVQLAPGKVLKTRVDLPARAAVNLHAEIEKDINRYTPFDRKDVQFDARIANVDSEGEQIRVMLLIAQTADVDEALEIAGSIGLRPGCVTDDAGTASAPLNLLPAGQRHRPRRHLPQLIRIEAVLLLCALVGLAALAWSERRDALETVDADIRQLRRVAVGAADMEQRLEALEQAAQQIELRKAAQPSVIAALETVTRSLSDHDYIASFDLSDGVLSMAGYSKDPTTMLLLLDKSPDLANPRFTAPTTRDERSGLQRFFVSIDLVQPESGQ